MSPLRGYFGVMGIVFYEDVRTTSLLYGCIFIFTKHPLPVKGRIPAIFIATHSSIGSKGRSPVICLIIMCPGIHKL
ncbi:hypothetical protein [Microbacter margulisiae]|nr:hypothetical protein [Microbacter margulisiae]